MKQANSRTKSNTYGLFWKNNRKRCCAFLAFESQEDRDNHMKWTKYWIKFLEVYRQGELMLESPILKSRIIITFLYFLYLEILLTRRASRFTGSTMNDTTESYLSVATNSTQTVKDINEILGPLPQVPTSELDHDWLRRQSDMSGIYEEIKDFKQNDISRASGVYEEMQFETKVVHNVTQQSPVIIPQLPPRKRVNTKDYELKRSNTNTEAELSKKKKSWTAKMMQGISRRFEATSPKKLRKPSLEKVEDVKSYVHRRQFKSTLSKVKRNSYSTPDLCTIPDSAKITYERGFEEFAGIENPDIINLSAENFSICFGPISSRSSSGVVADYDEGRSQRGSIEMNETFVINQVNCEEIICKPVVAENENHYQVPKNVAVRFIDETTGYCIMGPGKAKSVTPTDEEEVVLRPKLNSSESKVQENSSHYLSMRGMREEIDALVPKEEPKEEPIYANISLTEKAPPAPLKKKRISQTSLASTESHYQSPVTRHSVDEKVASFVPNEDFYLRCQKKHRSPRNSFGNSPFPRRRAESNIYTPPPVAKSSRNKHKLKQFSPPPKHSPPPIPVTAVVPLVKHAPTSITPTLGIKNTQNATSKSVGELNLMKSPTKSTSPQFSPAIPRVKGFYKKYATLGRNSKVSLYHQEAGTAPTHEPVLVVTAPTETSTLKKFSSLPRFRKIDFSPIRLKINSVLQRYQNGGH